MNEQDLFDEESRRLMRAAFEQIKQESAQYISNVHGSGSLTNRLKERKSNPLNTKVQGES